MFVPGLPAAKAVVVKFPKLAFVVTGMTVSVVIAIF